MSLKEMLGKLRLSYLLFIGVLVATAFGFFIVQNLNLLPGGDVAFCKVLWLLFAIIFWLVTPSWLAFDKALSAPDRLAMRLFALNMWLRALIELYMMYVTVNWHPYYGIGHDLFSVAVLLIALLRFQLSPWIKLYHQVLVAMFLLETYFAWYMLHNVIADEPVYYVPQDSQHSFVFDLTWAAVVVLLVYKIVFLQRWLRLGKNQSAYLNQTRTAKPE